MNYELRDNIALLTFDDGKANVVSHSFIDDMNTGLDRAEGEAAAVVITGREGMFSGGFDLEEFAKGPEAAQALVARGFEMLTRLYSHPQPLLVACSGHAVAAGAFILLAADTRVGAEGSFKLTLPETALGMTFPPVLQELVSARISIRHQTRVLLQSELYDPAGAIDAGFLDEVASPGEVLDTTLERAQKLAQLPGDIYGQNKRDLRASSLAVMRESLAGTA